MTGSNETRAWRRYEALRPDPFADIVDTAPVAYRPLGLPADHLAGRVTRFLEEDR